MRFPVSTLAVCLTASAGAFASPLAHWSFDGDTVPERLIESYGTSALNASETSSNAWSTRAGFGNVLSNGTNANYLTVPKSSLLSFGQGDFSLSLWSRRTSSSGSNSGILDALNGTGTGYQLFYQSNDTLRIRLDDDAGNSVLIDSASPVVSLNSWQNIITTVDRATNECRLFVNGVDVTASADISTLTGAINPDQDLWISGFNNTTPANGQLDDIAIFDRKLTPSEIAAINASCGTPVLSIWPAAAQSPPVTLSPPSGLLRAGETVTLSTDPGFTIRYTQDGSDPDIASPLYSAPLPLAAAGEIRARSFGGAAPGPVASGLYFPAPDDAPNIVIIFTDDIGYNDSGCYGSVMTATPNIDLLAYSGCRFTQFTTTGPGNLASQYSLLTARVKRRAGLPESLTPGVNGIDSREWTLAEALRKNGYETAFIGEWHLGDTDGSKARDQGFSLFHGLPYSLSQSPPLVENDTILNASPDPATLNEILTSRAENFLESNASRRFFLLFDPPSSDQIESVDTTVGRILDKIDALNLTNNTLVLFLSDEGASPAVVGSNGQLRDGNGSTWEGGVRVPAIASWPGTIPQTVSFATLWLPDILRSVADLTDSWYPMDRMLDGRARALELLGIDTRSTGSLPLFLHHQNELRAVRQGAWKLHLLSSQLYNVEVDPSERINLSAEQPSIASNLQQIAAAHNNTYAELPPQLPPLQTPFLNRVETSTGNSEIVITFTRPRDSLDDHYSIQFSDDLENWQDLPILPFIENTSSTLTSETLTLRVPFNYAAFSDPSIFVRLQATRP